ncbi:MAG: hypothetical protein WDM78_23140 [Puia sp.]
MGWKRRFFVAVKGWRNYYDLQMGDCLINSDGSNEWINGAGMKAHLTEKKSPQEMTTIITN